MNRLITGTVLTVFLSFQIQAADNITREHIQQVIDVTDAATKNRDTAGIGEYLSETFERIIEFTHEKYIAKVRVDKKKYLDLIDEGWPTLEEYDYQRDNTAIHIMLDGSSGQSRHKNGQQIPRICPVRTGKRAAGNNRDQRPHTAR